MNNLSVIEEGNLYTISIGGMSKGKLLDWGSVLLGDDTVVTELEDSNWQYILSIKNVTQAGVERVRGYDYNMYPEQTITPLESGYEVMPSDREISMGEELLKAALCFVPGGDLPSKTKREIFDWREIWMNPLKVVKSRTSYNVDVKLESCERNKKSGKLCSHLEVVFDKVDAIRKTAYCRN